MNFLEKIHQESLKNARDPKALTYLQSRGVTESQIDMFGIGYFSDETWPPYMELASPDFQAYLNWSRRGWKLRGKLIFPMRNALGTLKGIQVRSPDPEKKDYSKFYLESSDIDAVFFGTKEAMPLIWESKEVYLCEGMLDFFPLQRVFPNTLSTGTANVSANQIKFLKRFVSKINVVFDMDKYGDAFFDKFDRLHGRDFELVRKITYLGNDISDYWKDVGEDKFQEFFKGVFTL